METQNSQFENVLIRSENFIGDKQSENAINQPLKKYTQRSTESNKQEQSKSSELLSILESSAATWNLEQNNDISSGLDNLQFKSGLTETQSDYDFIRLRSHVLYTTACAHACFFVGIANRIR